MYPQFRVGPLGNAAQGRQVRKPQESSQCRDGQDCRHKSMYRHKIVEIQLVREIAGCGATAIYYVNYQVPFNALNSVYLALMGVANWLGATLGYDKVKQTIAQIGAKREAADEDGTGRD